MLSADPQSDSCYLIPQGVVGMLFRELKVTVPEGEGIFPVRAGSFSGEIELVGAGNARRIAALRLELRE